jgi:hypothetical protein
MRNIIFVFILLVGTCLCEDLKTTDGKEYKDVKVNKATSKYVILFHSKGINRIDVNLLPEDFKAKYIKSTATTTTKKSVDKKDNDGKLYELPEGVLTREPLLKIAKEELLNDRTNASHLLSKRLKGRMFTLTGTLFYNSGDPYSFKNSDSGNRVTASANCAKCIGTKNLVSMSKGRITGVIESIGFTASADTKGDGSVEFDKFSVGIKLKTPKNIYKFLESKEEEADGLKVAKMLLNNEVAFVEKMKSHKTYNTGDIGRLLSDKFFNRKIAKISLAGKMVNSYTNKSSGTTSVDILVAPSKLKSKKYGVENIRLKITNPYKAEKVQEEFDKRFSGVRRKNKIYPTVRFTGLCYKYGFRRKDIEFKNISDTKSYPEIPYKSKITFIK